MCEIPGDKLQTIQKDEHIKLSSIAEKNLKNTKINGEQQHVIGRCNIGGVLLFIFVCFIFFYFLGLHQVLVAARGIFIEAQGIFHCSMRASP